MNQTTAMAEQQPRQTCPKRGERSKRHLRQTGRVSIAVCIYPCMYDYALYVLQEGGEKAKECQKIRNRELWPLVGEIWSHQNTRAGRLWKHSWRHQFERSFKLFILFFVVPLFFVFGSFGRSLAAGNAADCGLWEQVVSTSCCDQGEAQSLSEFQTARCLLFFVCFVCFLFIVYCCLLLFVLFFVFLFFLGGWCFFGLFFCFLIVCFS